MMTLKNVLTLSLVASSLTLGACSSDDDDGDTMATASGETGDGDAESTTEGGDADAGTTESGDGDGDTTGETGDGDGDVGAVRLVHLGVFPGDTGTDVDIFVNGEASGITFGFKDTTDYVELPVGDYTFDIVPAGGTIDDSVATVADFAIAAGDSWEIFAYGYVADADAGEAFSVGAFAENKADIPEGNNRLNIVHAAAGAALSPIDVWAVDADCTPVEALFEDFNVGEYYEDVDLPDEAFKLGFDVGQDATVDACIEVPALGGAFVNAFAVNDDAGNVSIVAHLPDGTNAELLPE